MDKIKITLGRLHHGAGFLCMGTLRIAREDFDTSPADEYKKEVFDAICKAVNDSESQVETIKQLQKDKAELISKMESWDCMNSQDLVFAVNQFVKALSKAGVGK